ncbi:MAG TPA: FHA domain-containing protein, partial [Longimicrobium sp.]|nr:FHA domain-containing protein [Longimicrobium sp.]
DRRGAGGRGSHRRPRDRCNHGRSASRRRRARRGHRDAGCGARRRRGRRASRRCRRGTGRGGPLRSDRIQLVGESGRPVTVGVRTPLGKHMVRQFGEDSNVWDTEQFVLERGADGAWQLVPNEGTTNETLVNGEPVTSPRPLNDGDVIAVGRAEKGIAKLPLTVRSA